MADTAPYIWIAAAYLSGSVPYALLIGLAKGVDIRHHGSGNIGATNCGRTLGRRYGMLCFALDLLKGFVPVLAAGWWFQALGRADLGPADAGRWLAVAVAAVAGHVAPLWLRFRGGKGVATGFGVVLGVWPFLTFPALAALVTWGLVLWLSRYVALASIAGAVAMPLYFLAACALARWPAGRLWPFLAVTVLMAALIVIRHQGNIRRLLAGTESKVGQ